MATAHDAICSIGHARHGRKQKRLLAIIETHALRCGRNRLQLFVHLENRQECFLRDLDRADGLHALLALFLLLEQLALTRDIAAVALGKNVLAARLDRRTSNNLVADSALDRNLEELTRDNLLELIAQSTSCLLYTSRCV